MKRSLAILGFSFMLAVLAFSLPALAEERELRWGGDTEGGAPYMFQDPKDTTQVIGYEVEIIEAIAKKLGRKPVFVQNGWDNLIPGLQRKLYDVTLDGLEITPEHKQEVNFSIPYYATFLQLAVRRTTRRSKTWKTAEARSSAP